ncbi:hypothetical protein OIU84_017686, partial [Salix udensis]
MIKEDSGKQFPENQQLPVKLGPSHHSQSFLIWTSVSSPALLHNFTNSAIVFPLILTEHASSFRVCWGIWVRITEQG